VLINDRPAKALIDTGSSHTIVRKEFVPAINKGHHVHIVGISGVPVSSMGESCCSFNFNNVCYEIDCLVFSELLPGIDCVFGMNGIEKIGGIHVVSGTRLQLGVAAVASPDESSLKVVDKDFEAYFNGAGWRAKWKWKEEEPALNNKVAAYKISDDIKEEFEKEIDLWIANGWLLEAPGYDGPIIPLMAIWQPNKGKVRPVLDFRCLNDYVSSHSGSSVVCADSLREWRRKGENCSLLDLRKAYLQVSVDSDLWNHQVIKHKGKYYYLTRLGFGLSSAPKIMSAIVSKVLSLDSDIRNGTAHYIDDIIVDEDVVSVERVMLHLRKFGLECKPPESLETARVLGLQLYKQNDRLFWKRGNEFPSSIENPTKRSVFSLCGSLLGHFPVASWLRVAAGYAKRCCTVERWNDYVGDTVKSYLKELIDRVRNEDPVGGVWNVPRVDGGVVWCDASAIALGAVLEIDGFVVEDGAWLRKKDDNMHINVAELDSVVKGVNLALKWNVRKLLIMTDSTTVHGWLSCLFSDSKRIRTKGVAEMLVRRRLSVIQHLISDYNVEITIKWTRSEDNKADKLTRVPKKWLTFENISCVSVDSEEMCDLDRLKEVHKQTHVGVSKTMYVAKQIGLNVPESQVRAVVRDCAVCTNIDPAPIRWNKGSLSVNETWYRLAVDITHFENVSFLSAVDCGPSRYAIWKRLASESTSEIVRHLERIFMEFGPPTEMLCDNGAAFRCEAMMRYLRNWNVRCRFRCAYRPSGNGIVERNHRTIKKIAARCRKGISNSVFLYNATPKSGDGLCPSFLMFGRSFRFPFQEPAVTCTGNNEDSRFSVGEQVYVKPPHPSCTEQWKVGRITGINDFGVEVDGFPRHIADVRRCNGVDELSSSEEQPVSIEVGDCNQTPAQESTSGRPLRARRFPVRFQDYEL